MTNKITFLLIFIFSGLYYHVHGQDDWSLKEEKDGISVYTKDLPDSRFKAIKVNCILKTSLTQMVAVILDVNTGADWVYSTKSSVLLKKVSPSELYYYSEVGLPWPITNRDFIAHLIVTQDPHTRVVTINGPTVPGYLPDKKGIVRVASSEGKWILTPLADHRVGIEYTLRTDPGGSIPAWVVNLFATKGPLESFKNLKVQLQKAQYTDAWLPFLKN